MANPVQPAEMSGSSPAASGITTFKAILLLVLGVVIGAGGMAAYALLLPRPAPENRTIMARFILPVPVATCKQIMVLGFRVAGFQNVVPDAGDDVGVGAPGDKISGAALCMPALGAATVAMSGTDPALLLKQIQAFSSAVATTNAASPPQRR
jgi:hypothetical protein